MYYYYQPCAGLYRRDVHGDAIPAGAVAITDEQHASILAALNTGKTVDIGDDGSLVFAAPPPPPPPPPPTVGEVKAEAARRLAPTDWTVTRQAEGGKPIPEAVAAYRAAVRAASDTLEAMEPIPADYADDRHWPMLGD